MERDRVVHERRDSPAREVRLQLVAPVGQDREEVVRRFAARRHLRQLHPPQLACVELGDLPAPPVPAVEVAQLDAQDRGLHLVEPAVETFQLVHVPRPLPVVAEHTQALGQARVRSRDRARVPIGTEVLRGIEAEARERAEGADPPPAVARPVGLGAVLDDRDAELGERSQVGGRAVEVDRHDRLRARPNGPPHGRGIEQQGPALEVRRHGPRARHTDAGRGRDTGIRGKDDLVARSDTERQQRERDRLRARRAADGVLDAQPGRELALERLALLAQHEAPAREDGAHRGVDLRPDHRVLAG